ncbi:hypothetical protein ABT095_38610 [Kitasatospora sp. NPDC002227]|uniref:hypothetical protein n=1 Tax=Kitasatospora sp. NPDC002227 TaxID=3154773 RepID=UPI003328E589
MVSRYAIIIHVGRGWHPDRLNPNTPSKEQTTVQDQMTFDIADSAELDHQGAGEAADEVQAQLRAGVEAWRLPVDATGRTVRPDHLAVQDFYEQTHARRVKRVFEQGSWLAEMVSEVDGSTFTEGCNRLRIVTQEAIDALVRVAVEANGHHGQVIESIAGGRAGQFRVRCSCEDGFELVETGHSRAIAWRGSEAEARALFAEHASAAGAPAAEATPAQEGGAVSDDQEPAEAFAMVLESAPVLSVPVQRAASGGGATTWAGIRPEAFGKVRAVQPVLFAPSADAVGTGSLFGDG